MMDLEFLRGLIDAVDESGIDNLEIQRAGWRIRISKTAPASTLVQPANNALVATHAPPSSAAPAVAAASPAAPATAAASAAEAPSPGAGAAGKDWIDIKSPMVGTFYRAPAPEAPPYVDVGSNVVPGQTLCILEAMKLMNEMESEVSGVVREVLVDNGEPVEYGQVLFRVEPNRS